MMKILSDVYRVIKCLCQRLMCVCVNLIFLTRILPIFLQLTLITEIIIIIKILFILFLNARQYLELNSSYF